MHAQDALTALGKASEEANSSRRYFEYWAVVAIVKGLLAIAAAIRDMRD